MGFDKIADAIAAEIETTRANLVFAERDGWTSHANELAIRLGKLYAMRDIYNSIDVIVFTGTKA